MTKSTSPAANAGLPTIDRRSLVYGLGTAAIAGVPALGGAAPMSDDPVFQAMAALEQLKILAGDSGVAHSVAEGAIFAARKENVVTLDGEQMRTHEQIEAHFTPAFGPEDEEQFNNFVERLRPRRLSDAEWAERDRARQDAHDELARKEAEIAEVERRIGYREIEAQQESANDAVWDAEYEVMGAKPATQAGAVALLRFVAELMEGVFPDDDEHESYVEAIRNAADFFEGRASA
jgi:formiminotetrahydrofolate cyclodeaminase